MKKLLLTILLILFAAPFAGAATHYVADDGSASWANSTNRSTPCSMATANSSASAADTVIILDGSYTSVGIAPSNSGTSTSARIIFQSENQYGAVFSGALVGIFLDNKDYIVVDGIKVSYPQRPILVRNGASYNEIKNSWFTDNYSVDPLKIFSAEGYDGCIHNWFHHNTIESQGGLYWSGSEVEDGGGMYLGGAYLDNVSNYNTLEYNTFSGGGHHNLEVYTNYNVLRGNFFS